MTPMRNLDRDTRRVRLLAARIRPVGEINHEGILRGDWDGGNVVRQFRDGAGDARGLAPYSTPPKAED